MPISPTPSFFSQVHLLAAALRRNGGALSDARIVVTIGRDEEPFDVEARQPWARRYGIEWRWMDASRFAAWGLFGTAVERFTYPFEADVVLLLDADTICTGALDELIELGDGALAGLVAHAAPTALAAPVYADGGAHVDADFWSGLYAAAELPRPSMPCTHTGWGLMDADPSRRACPPYFNLGVLAGSREAMSAVGERIYAELAAVDRFVDSFFRCQLALTLALERTGTPWRELPLRFNFPNDEQFADAHPDEAAEVRILHYLRGDQIERSAIATSAEQLDAFLARTDLSPTNARLRDTVAQLRGELASEILSHA